MFNFGRGTPFLVAGGIESAADLQVVVGARTVDS